MEKRIEKLLLKISLIFGVVLAIGSCKREPLVYLTSTNVNITTYLENNPDKFSEFSKILELSKTDGFLQAYGKYTLFLPTNDAVKAYLQKIGKTSVEEIAPEELRALVTFHVLNDTISTRKFNDGKLNSITMYGQYLTSGSLTENGITTIRVNNQANILRPNVVVGNGIIHEIDHVLEPAKKTLADIIQGNPNFSIFTEALRVTGFLDTLKILPADNSNTARKWMTVLIETDSVLKKAGFADFNALKARYANTSDQKSQNDSLHLFVAYHILYDLKYLADIASGESHATAAPSEPIFAKRKDQLILINDLNVDSYEPGVVLDRSRSDVAASNGVLHVTAPYASVVGTTTGHYAIAVRKPKAVYWDVADFKEIRALVNYYGKQTAPVFYKVTATDHPITGWDWEKTGTKYGMDYIFSNTSKFVNNDYMHLALGVPTAANPGSATNSWVTLRTPILIKGKYKVWFCYERREQTGQWPTGRRTQCKVTIGNQVMVRPFDFAEPPPTATSMKELESQGWKYYTSNPVTIAYDSKNKPSNVFVGKLVGIVDIPSTNTYPVRLDVLQGNSSTDYLDMVHFIPVDAPSQILPRFTKDGQPDMTEIP